MKPNPNTTRNDICIQVADQMETIFLGDSISEPEDFRKAKKVIHQLLADSKREWQEELIGEVEENTLNLQTVWMQAFIDSKKGREPTSHSQFWDGGVKALAELMTILHILKGDND